VQGAECRVQSVECREQGEGRRVWVVCVIAVQAVRSPGIVLASVLLVYC